MEFNQEREIITGHQEISQEENYAHNLRGMKDAVAIFRTKGYAKDLNKDKFEEYKKIMDSIRIVCSDILKLENDTSLEGNERLNLKLKEYNGLTNEAGKLYNFLMNIKTPTPEPNREKKPPSDTDIFEKEWGKDLEK